MSVRSFFRRVAITIGVLIILVAVRIALQPRRTPTVPLQLGANERSHVSGALAASALGPGALADALASERVLLVGESHFQREPQAFLENLVADLHARDGRRALLVLELPAPMQESLDRYIATGDERGLAAAWQRFDRFALPYQELVRWARAHPQAVSGIVADDERPLRTGLMRLFLTDTRNATMARAISDACRAHPADRIVVFGGRLHMMKGGRYMYDSPTRSPIGARLNALSNGPRALAVVWLFAGDSPAAGTWTRPGAVSFARPAGELPIPVLEDEAIFGATRLREVADYAVYLGPATPIKANRGGVS